MDKKNTTIGILLLLGAIASFYFSAKFAAPPSPPRPGAPTTSASSPAAAPAGTPATAQPAAGLSAATPAAGPVAAKPVAGAPAEYETLANEFLEVRFTNQGGAIDRIALKKHTAVQNQPELYMLNGAQAAPALSLTDFPGADRFTAYTLVSRSSTEVVYRAVADDLEVTRRYSLAKTAKLDDYQIRHETTFRNLGDKTLPLPRASLNLGTAAPLNAGDNGLYLNAGFFDGEDATFIGRGDLEGGGLLAGVGLKDGTPPPFIEKPAAFVWASVKNQFFAMILTPDQPGTGIRTERVLLDPKADPSNRQAYGVTSYARFELKPLAAGASETLAASYFAGPKEYKRLSNADIFVHSESKVLQFDTYFFNRMFFSGFFAPLLLTIMTWVQSLVGNWGWAIVITTLILKIVFLPFTLAASRSAKRMAKLNPLMQAMREKFKDNPQKIQSETLRLFKENKVNPLGGCIPILITIPFFVGFFAMLQSACDLRFASFLWVADLSAQDTIARVFGLPINIMPILMGATMIIQMRLTPTPTTDNAQATMMKIMPWMFTLFCYTFASGLALYSTINGLFTIIQQLVINRMPEPELPAVAATAGGKPGPGGMKNVTPKKKVRPGRSPSTALSSSLPPAVEGNGPYPSTPMAGHNKWSKVKRAKAVTDARRAKIFSKIARDLTMAARAGGGDPAGNARLRTLLTRAREANMPADNVDRAIKKGTGELPGVVFEELHYEGYGPGGVAFIVLVTTDNKQRTAQLVRSTFANHGGNLALNGAVAFQFLHVGQFLIPAEQAAEDRVMEVALEAGADDILTTKEGYEVRCNIHEFDKVASALDRAGLKPVHAEIAYLPTVTVPITKLELARSVIKLHDALEMEEDVSAVFSNEEMDDALAEAAAE